VCPAFVSGPLRAAPGGAAAQAQVATETTGLVGDLDVYSDEPFPPLASTAATLETPTFSKRRRHAARIAGRSEGSTR
jgi:hypothetical protein